MLITFNNVFQTSLAGVQLFFFAILGFLAVYKMYLSQKNQAKFLLVFYLFALLDILVYSSMMIYQLVKLAINNEIYMIVLVVINVYSMIIQAVIISLLSFYWKETEAILRGSGIESLKSVSGIKNQLMLKGLFLGIWFLIYSAFLAYSIVTDNYIENQIYKDIFYFGGQGFSTFLLIWVNFSQAMNAKQFSFTLKRYQTLVSYQMNKGKFRCIYWVATTTNFIRLAYLIVAAVYFRIKTQSEQQQWIGMFIYTASALIPLSIYIYSFQVAIQKPRNSFTNDFTSISEKSDKDTKQVYEPPSLTSPQQKKKSKQMRQSFNETELSSSYDSHGI